MCRKLCILVSFVLVLAFVDASQAVVEINIINHSFELGNDGNQLTCDLDGEDMLAWIGEGGYGGGTSCDELLPGTTCDCWSHEDTKTGDAYGFPDGYLIAWIQGSYTSMRQFLDINDPNTTITEGRLYELTWWGLAWWDHALKAELYYPEDANYPDANIVEVTSFIQDLEQSGATPWDFFPGELKWVAAPGYAGLGKKLGIRFTGVTGNSENYIFFDDIHLTWDYATNAYSPNPDKGAVEVPKDANLIWSPGFWAKDVNGHDVYFGSTWAEVNSATTASAEFMGNQDANEYDPGTMVLGNTYYWRIDEVNENYVPGPVPVPPNGRWKGEVWSFTVEGLAKNPHPGDGANDVPKNVILRWTAGADSKWHDVYFGTSEAAVTAATTASSEYKTRLNLGTELYDAGTNENPAVGEQYFWRIDEVNTLTVKGYIWNFTVANYILIDDFDFYANPTELRGVWKDYYSGADGEGVVWVNKDANYAVDGNSMLFEYWNDIGTYYSETWRNYSTGQDWSYSGNGVTALEIDFIGDMNNGPDPPMYVKLSDGTNTAQVNLPDHNDILEEEVHTWNIPLKDFSGVTLSNITRLVLGIGDKVRETGGLKEEGTIYFDDIRLNPPRCFTEYGPAGDITGDCRVDVNDLTILIQDWCKSGGWFEAAMPTTQPVVEYLFEEGTGTIVANTGSYGSTHNLTIGKGVDANHTPVTDPNNDPCWVNDSDPCRGWTLWFDGRDGSYDNWDDVDPLTGGGGDYLLGMSPLNLNSNTVTLATWLKPDPWLIDPKKGIYEQSGGFTGLIHTRDANTEAAGMSYNFTGGYTYNGELGYDWVESETWQFHSGIVIPDWQWSMAAVVIEPEQAILYLADFNNVSDANDDV
ncbi:MAG: hypothetical protein JSV82_02125, partial [Planctomycetota bacterium]